MTQSIVQKSYTKLHEGGCSLQSAGIIWVQFFTNKYNQNIWQMVLKEWQHNDTQKMEVSKAFTWPLNYIIMYSMRIAYKFLLTKQKWFHYNL